MVDEKIPPIREWLSTGSINIFGLPMSGKDTVGTRLASALDAELLSSGGILRTLKVESANTGFLSPTEQFHELILPYVSRPEYADKPLVLSSVGRWSGEEDDVMAALEHANHPLRAVLLLNISESQVWDRWEEARILADRQSRADDRDRAIFEIRLSEFHDKTAPVISHYQQLGFLVPISADAPRDTVFANVIEGLYNLATKN